jgi:hypothetical protein
MSRFGLLVMLLASMLLFSMSFVFVGTGYSSSFSSSETLLGAGAKWAGHGGTRAAYVDFYDNLIAHPNPNVNLNLDLFLQLENEVVSVLQGEGYSVDTYADIPSNLSQYNLVYFEAYFANDPADEPAIRNYILDGGGAVFWEGSMNYLVYASKTMNTGLDLTSIEPWLGASQYVNTGGAAVVSLANPFGTTLNVGDALVSNEGYSNAGIVSVSTSSQIVASWNDGVTFALAHEYGSGRVYWQSTLQNVTPLPPPPRGPLSLALYGAFDYGTAEQAKVKVIADLRDTGTMGPVSNANVTIQVFSPDDSLWVSANMAEIGNGTGTYEWTSLDTVANMNLQVGVYLTKVTATYGGLSVYQIILFHIDPPPTTGTVGENWYLLTVIAIMFGGILAVLVMRKRAFALH